MIKGVGYARLSKDDGSRYSSIESQIQLIKEFAKEQKIELVNIYIDDNVSGFIEVKDRPEFSKMLEDINNGIAECIIAKDLSRIGRKNRNYTYTTRWLESTWYKFIINSRNGKEI